MSEGLGETPPARLRSPPNACSPAPDARRGMTRESGAGCARMGETQRAALASSLANSAAREPGRGAEERGSRPGPGMEAGPVLAAHAPRRASRDTRGTHTARHGACAWGDEPGLPPGPRRSTMRSTSFRTAQLNQRASQMRHAPTTSEARLFELLRSGQLGVTFRRQVPVLGRYIADL